MTGSSEKVILQAIQRLDKRIDELEASVSRWSKEQGDDRKKIDDVILSTNHNTEQVKIMREDINNLSKTTTKAVSDAVDDHVEPVMDILKKVNQNPSKKSLLDWLFRKKEVGK